MAKFVCVPKSENNVEKVTQNDDTSIQSQKDTQTSPLNGISENDSEISDTQNCPDIKIFRPANVTFENTPDAEYEKYIEANFYITPVAKGYPNARNPNAIGAYANYPHLDTACPYRYKIYYLHLFSNFELENFLIFPRFKF